MGLICVVPATGEVLEYQERARAGTLINNAMSIPGRPFTPDQLEEREVTTAQARALHQAWNTSPTNPHGPGPGAEPKPLTLQERIERLEHLLGVE